MELFSKPPVNMGKAIIKSIAIALVLFFSVPAVLMSADACFQYPGVRDKAVTVHAAVSRVEVDHDPEDGDEYDVYIQYPYAGETYEVLYGRGLSDKSWTDRIGQQISVQINPDRPEELLEMLQSDARRIVFELMLMNVSFWFWAMPHYKSWTEVYGTGRSFVQKDLENKLHRRWLWKWGALTGAEMIVLKLLFPEVLSGWVLLWGGLFAFLGFKGGKRLRTDLRRIRDGAFTIREDMLVDKYEDYDSDGGKDYHLSYSNGTDTWSMRVSHKEYHSAQMGQTRCTVYLDGERRPELVLKQTGLEAV